MDGTANERITYCSRERSNGFRNCNQLGIRTEAGTNSVFWCYWWKADHGLANIQMLLKGLEVEIEMCIVDNKNEITVKKWVHI